MIWYIELGLIKFFEWYFNSSFPFAIPSFIAIVILFIMQFSKQNKNPLPGFAAIVLCSIEFMHFQGQAKMTLILNNLEHALNTPTVPQLSELPFGLDYIFTLFVGPIETRTFYNELIFVILASYIICFIKIAWSDFKLTGLFFDNTSISGLSNDSKKAFSRPERSDSNELGSGDLATTEQIIKWTKHSQKEADREEDTAIHVKNLMGSNGIAVKDGELVWPAAERNRHILFIAKTGGGKTTSAILPILYNDCLSPHRSTIVIDSKPEMWGKLANMTRKYNPRKKIMLFNPLDTNRGMSWNILGKIEDDTDCKLIANTLISATDNPASKGDSPFFRNNALAVINAIMVGLLKDPNETLSMPRIHSLVQSGMKNLGDWLEAHPEAYRTSRTFVELARSGSQNADTIMSEMSMRIAAWDLKAVRATTAKDELKIESLITEPTLFIVEFRESELEMLRPIANVIVIELLRYLTKQAEFQPGAKLPIPVGFVIDEFASALGRLPDIHVKLNTLRSRNVSIVAAIQSIGQVKANYSEHADSVLAGFTTTILIPTLDFQDSEWASKQSGQMTIRFKTATSNSNRKIIEWFTNKSVGSNETVQQRAVLTPDEVGRPLDKRATFFMPETPPFQGFLVPFYEIPELNYRLSDRKGGEFYGIPELKFRDGPIEYDDALFAPPPSSNTGGRQGLPPGISDTSGWSNEQLEKRMEELRVTLDWENTTGGAKKWWEAFENQNKNNLKTVVRLAEELASRNATISEFFLSYIYSNTNNIQANLYYLDYTRLKKEQEKKDKAANS